jgi:gamma-glutamyltranspeptidase / glutathione hydrolase
MKKSAALLVFLLLPGILFAPNYFVEPVGAKHAIVTSTSQIASQVGIEIINKGGNAVDAAVAVGLALAVTWPRAGNLGGGGFMLIRPVNGEAEMIDYRERAPLAATPDMYIDRNGKVIPDASVIGYRAVAVPGTIAGLALAHSRHGKLKWRDVVEPARKLAADGFIINSRLANGLKEKAQSQSKFPESNRIFLRNGRYFELGERFIQSDLAETLKRIQEKGPREFYEGATAKQILQDMNEHGGLITAEDFKQYVAVWRKPLHGTYRGYEIITIPPPSSGGTLLLEMLNILELYNIRDLGYNSAAQIHLLAETMKRAYADRSQLLGDPDFVNVPVAALISKEYAKRLAQTIDDKRATPAETIRPGILLQHESSETTHFTVVDKEGNIVTNTYTLNNPFGSFVTVPKTGILLNDEMDDFISAVGTPHAHGLIESESNAIAPKKRPLSSMTPTIVLKDGKPYFAFGSPGGATIPNTVLQVIMNIVDFGMNLQQAVNAPRFHHHWLPDEIWYEPFGLNPDTRKILESMGHKFAKEPHYLGDVEGIMIDSQNGMRLGASDPRLSGAPAGN